MKISKAFWDNLDKVAQEKETSKENIINILKTALEKSYLKENPDMDIETEVNEEKETIKLFEKRVVVDKTEDEIDDDKEINLADANKLKKSYKIGDVVKTEVEIGQFERRLAFHFGQILNHNLNEISNSKIYEEWKDKVGYIIRAEVEKNERFVEINLGTTKGVLLKSDQIPGEYLSPGQSYLFVIKEVKQQTKGWPIILSRSDERLLKYLLKNEISEIANGTIEIKKIARIVGYKTKVAIASKIYGVDAIGTAVGPKGERIKKISQMLNNERIDVILYDDDPKQFLVNACHPEKILGIEISDDEDKPGSKIITIVCPEDNLYKLIGKNGVNVKLLSKLTGWSIDVVSDEFAKESKIKYEDISNLVSSKVKQPKSTFTNNKNNQSGNNWKSNNNKRNNNNDFYNNFSADLPIDTPFDYEQYRADLESITDDDVESLLNTTSINSTKRQKKNFDEDEEEIVLVDGTGKEIFSEEPVKEKRVSKKKQVEVKEFNPNEIEADEPIVIKKPVINIDDIGGDDPLLKNKKEKTVKNKNINKQPKEKKEKVNVFDELMDDTDDISVEESIDTSELDNLELEDE
ncbi:MAG: transcription termination factor NusA [Malacoplasma sp.]|nr:transcription termination factor NusA [Malacoplasma sp.]